VSDRIKLSTEHEPTKEELLRKAAEDPASRCFTIEASLDEEGVIVIGYPDFELRDLDVPMLVKVSDGMSQGEFLFYWREIGEVARNNWDKFLYYLRLFDYSS
jgi:hypothetical protein